MWIDEIDLTRKGKEALKANNYEDDLLRKKVISKIDIHHTKTRDDVTFALRSRSFSLAQITGVKNIQMFANDNQKNSNRTGNIKSASQNNKK